MTDQVPPQTRVLAIVGPTAVGKTEVAELVAARLGGEIISADSMQVYRGMDIGTAKQPPSQRQVRYWGLDVARPGTPFSAALYQRIARDAIADISKRGRLPIIVGGSGLYVRAALDAMEFPAGDMTGNVIRASYQQFVDERGPKALHALLSERDPASARILHPNNVRRVIRALEMLDDGVSYADQAAGFSARRSVYDARLVGLTMDRDLLYTRIDARIDTMLDEGLLDEVRSLLAAGFRETLTASQAIGYKELVGVAEGQRSIDEAIGAIKQATRRYAKRQLTWFRADPRVTWIDVTGLSALDAAEAVMSTLCW